MELEEIKKMALEIAEKQKEQPITTTDNKEVVKQNSIDDKINEVINVGYDTTIEKAKQSKEFFQRVTENATEKLDNQLRKDKLENLNEKQQLELGEYILNCEKSKLKERKKREKKLIKTEVQCEIAKRQYDALYLRYGYMYKNQQEFIPSAFYNWCREVVNWYNGTSKLFRKVVKSTLVIIFTLVIGYIMINVAKFGLNWFITNFEIKS